MIDRELTRETGTSGAVVTDFSPATRFVEVVRGPPPSETSSSIPVLIFRELADDILSALETFATISGTRALPEAREVGEALERYLSRTLESMTDRGTPVQGLTLPRLTGAGGQRFGMSETTARRLWDNDADRIWDDV